MDGGFVYYSFYVYVVSVLKEPAKAIYLSVLSDIIAALVSNPSVIHVVIIHPASLSALFV